MRQLFKTIVDRLKGQSKPRGRRRLLDGSTELADLLGRRPVNLDTPELQRFLAGKRVLVTGAGGSIGSEICRQMLKFCPASLVLVDRAENALFEIDRELRHSWKGAEIRPVIADICDARRIAHVFETERPQVVFHAAAHKHVPMMELHPGEAVKNNVFGTKIVADAAVAAGTGAFVLVSTDKAVNPTSVMGATKRVAEGYVQSLNQRDDSRSSGSSLNFASNSPSTRFVAVRFGNVIGSSGSVVPIFNKQIDAGGPVTVTHADMRRYFMTIPEASQLVMQAGAIGQGGEIFVLDMGEPVRILDLANEMIRRRGLVPGADIEVQFTGIRPGEKLYEELSCGNEQIAPTSHEKIHVWELPAASHQQMRKSLELLAESTHGTAGQVRFALCQAVPEYRPTEPITEMSDSEQDAAPSDQAAVLRALAAASRAA